jgi:hypothetical protein
MPSRKGSAGIASWLWRGNLPRIPFSRWFLVYALSLPSALGPFTMTNKRDNSESLDLNVWMSKGDASRARGVSRQAIWELVRRGRLTTRLYKGRVYVSRAEVMGFKPRPRGPAGTGYVKRKTIKRKKIKPPDASKWIYLVEAARETGLPRLAIVDLVRRGRIKKVVSGTKTFVSRAGLEGFMRQQGAGLKNKFAKKK